MGEGVRAELIEGIVYLWSTPEMPSPVSVDHHAAIHDDLIGWLSHYRSKTPGLIHGNNVTVFLDGIGEPQPDVLLGIPETAGGKTKTVVRNGKQYIEGAPEFIAEISASSASIDLNAKLIAYQRNGVGEYLVVLTEDEQEVRWMALVDDRFVNVIPDAEGLFKSRLFPGLWLDPAALLTGDLPTLFAAVDRGCSGADHTVFRNLLAAAAK
jgi:Uma2 family endonuclease